MINDEEAPAGRLPGEPGWAGLANLFYWIDCTNGIGGFRATQIPPFAGPVSFTAYMDFETAGYDHVRSGSLTATRRPRLTGAARGLSLAAPPQNWSGPEFCDTFATKIIKATP